VSDTDCLVHHCEGCQFFDCQKHVPSHQLQTILITCPFSIWGLDLVGPFKKARGEFKDIFVAVDKFIKWIEVKRVASITTTNVMEFIKEIMYRFGVPNNIITDNGTQFTVREFKDFCADSSIKINYASVSHPQSNGQVEYSNGMILQGLKPIIFDRLNPYTEKWVKELPSILWAVRMSHPVLMPKLNAFLYVCQDQVSHIKVTNSEINSKLVFITMYLNTKLITRPRGLHSEKISPHR
jgi:hypothetical protein